jgi:hypothetical protein
MPDDAVTGSPSIAIEDERGGGLHDAEARGQLRAVGDVQVDVRHGIRLRRQLAQHAGRGAAGCADLGRELQEGRAEAQGHAVDGDDIARRDAADAAVAAAPHDAEQRGREHEAREHGDDGRGFHGHTVIALQAPLGECDGL